MQQKHFCLAFVLFLLIFASFFLCRVALLALCARSSMRGTVFDAQQRVNILFFLLLFKILGMYFITPQARLRGRWTARSMAILARTTHGWPG